MKKYIAPIVCIVLAACGCEPEAPRTDALDAKLWGKSEWISASDAKVTRNDSELDVSWFAGEFANEAEVTSAKWMTTALGTYNLWVNGKSVGAEDFLKPGYTHIHKTRRSFTYDVTKLLKKGKLMHRELTNNYLLDRISGFMFDLMIIAGVAAIDLSQLSGMWWQLLIVCALGTVATFIYLRVACNHLYPGYKEEAFFSMFGMLTGTASNGMILLREIDPKFETPAANNLVLQGIPAIAFGGVLLLLFNICNTIEHCWLVLALLIVAWVVYTIILFRKALFKKAYAKKAAKKAKK